MQSKDVAVELFKSDHLITFQNTADYHAYTPKENFDEILIFYPGALIETKVYISLCKKIAKIISKYIL